MPDRTPTSPRQIQIDPHLPQPSRNMSMTSPVLTPSRQSIPHRNSHGGPRSYRHADDADARERQMQQDIESAMSMSRARSGSLADTSPPIVRPSAHHFPSTSPIEERSFPMLSDAEEAEMNRARYHHGPDNGSDDEHGHGRSHYDNQEDREEEGLMHDHHHGHGRGDDSVGGSSGYDSHARLLDRRGSDGHQHRLPMSMGMGNMERQGADLRSLGGMGGVARNRFDFAAMEEYANKEKQNLSNAEFGGGTWAMNNNNNNGISRRRSTPNKSPSATNSNRESQEDINQPRTGGGSFERTQTMSAFGDEPEHEHQGEPDNMTEGPFSPASTARNDGDGPTTFHRRRQRKLSQSNPIQRRQGKLALFEGFGNSGNNGGLDGEVVPESSSTAFKAPRSGKGGIPIPSNSGGGAGGFAPYSDIAPPAPGHDRPYRFSFYSNAMPVTIHARSLAELPAENQTFEELFKGKNQSSSEKGTPNRDSGQDTPQQPQPQHTEPSTIASKTSMLSRAMAAHDMSREGSKQAGGGGGNGDNTAVEEDPEQFTWWLDVLSPTDEEMRMLSKVFGIHPLTTEDILLEETREKIELFRNYYLVCFRSFDQDPYSQTYLEPLNMYIIVFREGTLSFHFRGTPHPQNVRRRIKHLKDYISVTSDWISYALIDDITDAFGPLIQSIEYEVDSIDELVLILKEAEQSDMLRRIGTCRKKVMGLLRLMGNKADVVKGLAKRCNEQWLVAPKSDIGLYLSDIQDHLITMTQNLNHYEKILSRSHSNYLAQISIEMTDANNQINDVLSKLTALGTVLIPMNLVTGLWGMNVHVPGEDTKDGYAWFGGILGGLALFAILGAWATYKCFVVR
ncbi:magnesium transporter [Kwoniella mangroviensis CBS 10435]|uniref:Magnesium transporter n=1 Tax=Kwoniella mangroviensis CBS 10435 TaxID=1331196 RepID=A0A1B9IPY5_9TREE|nr:magnesium transporter [Kwoniella mangroviensis CBS 10435]